MRGLYGLINGKLSSLYNKVGTPNNLASCASEIAATKHITGTEKSGLREKIWMFWKNIINDPIVEAEEIILFLLILSWPYKEVCKGY